MDINFPLILLVLVSAGTLIWLLDVVWLRKRRAPDAPEPALVENARSLTPILALVFLIRSFMFEPFQIPSASMVPTLLIGDFILVNKYTYGIRLPVWRTKILSINEPQRGDIMVFFPPHKDQYYIKRVVGLPGDLVEYEGKVLSINGEQQPQQLLAALPKRRPVYELRSERLDGVEHEVRHDYRRPEGDFSQRIPAGHYFMMGDNRDNSADSRIWGMVPEARIVGKAVGIWMHKEPGWHLPEFERVGSIQ